MITQLFLNGMSNALAFVVGLIPALPDAVNVLVGNIEGGELWLTNHLGVFGIIMPWGLMEGFVAVWLSLVAFWTAVHIALLVMHVIRPNQW